MSNTKIIAHKTSLNQFAVPVSVPVYQTTSFVQDVSRLNEYTKANSIVTLKNIIAKLNSNKVGIIFGSRLVAIEAIADLLKAGDEIIIVDNNEKSDSLIRVDERSGVSVNYINASSIKNIFQSITPRTKLIWVKTSTSPGLKISDIQTIAKTPKPAGIQFAWITLLLSNQYNSFLRWELVL
jgi:cystathionine beta-lyase